MRRALFVAFATILAASGCKHEIPKPNEHLMVTPFSECDTAIVYFVNDILPIFNSSCATIGCHDATTHTEGYVLDSYSGIMHGIQTGDPGGSEIYQKITTSNSADLMPPLSSGITLTQEQKDLVYNWIAQGAHYNECSNDSCSSDNVSYSGTLALILQTHCNSCHAGNFPSGNINLSTYSGVATVALNGRLMGALNHSTGYVAMPQGAAQLDSCTLARFTAWVTAGAPNN